VQTRPGNGGRNSQAKGLCAEVLWKVSNSGAPMGQTLFINSVISQVIDRGRAIMYRASFFIPCINKEFYHDQYPQQPEVYEIR
jgi:hypothetical protein